MLMWINVLITHRSDGIFCQPINGLFQMAGLKTHHTMYTHRMEDNIRRNYTGHLHIALTAQTQQRTQTERQRSTELLSKIPLYYERIGEECRSTEVGGWS